MPEVIVLYVLGGVSFFIMFAVALTKLNSMFKNNRSKLLFWLLFFAFNVAWVYSAFESAHAELDEFHWVRKMELWELILAVPSLAFICSISVWALVEVSCLKD